MTNGRLLAALTSEEKYREYAAALEDIRARLRAPLIVTEISFGRKVVSTTVGQESILSDHDRTLVAKHLRTLGSAPSGAVELDEDKAAFSLKLQCATSKTEVSLVVVEPEVLPEDALREDRLGAVLPWAGLIMTPDMSMENLVVEAISGMEPRAFLFGICTQLAADAGILWMLDPQQDRPHIRARAVWGVANDVGEFDIPRDRGIVGRLNRKSEPAVHSLEGSKPYNLRLVEDEGWKYCLAIPVTAGGQLIGAVSLYTRSEFQSDIVDLASAYSVSVNAIQFIRRYRKIALEAERETLVESRLERLQIGVELLGFTHDLAENAQRTADGVKQLNENLQPKSLAPKTASVLRDLTKDASLVHRITRAMNRLAGGQSKEITNFDVREYVLAVEPILESISDQVHVTIPKGLVVRGDPLDLQRIIINLVSNANYWTPDNGGSILVDAERSEVDGQKWVDVYVKDNGRGMSPAVRRNAPRLLYTMRKNGLGLGLFVVTRLAERLGGSFSIVHSEPHSGTWVRVRIPLAQKKNR